MITLGINAYHGDASAAVFLNDELVVAVEEERFTRQKHQAGFPTESIRWCLSEVGASIADVAHAAISRDPLAHLPRKLAWTWRHRPTRSSISARARNTSKILDVRDALEGFARHFLHQLGMMHAITLFGGHVGDEFVTDRTTFHLLFQARHDLAAAMQVGQRLATLGTVDDLTFVVSQRVMEGGNGVLGNLHVSLTNRFKSAGQVPTRSYKVTRTR